MRSFVIRGGALLGSGLASYAIYKRHSETSSLAMSPGRLQTPDGSGPGRDGDRGDAMEAVKAGILGHTAQMAGVRRGGALKGVDAFETTFAVPMHCESCVHDIEGTVSKVEGIESAKADLQSGLLHIKGTTAPSIIVSTLQAAGRDAILRGSGASNSAAVCILELDTPRVPGKSPVRGLARLFQVNKTHTLIDLPLSGLNPGKYEARIRTAGDISEGVASLGKVWVGTEGLSTREGVVKGDLGTVEVDDKGRGAAYIAQEMSVWEIIGRGMSVMKEGAVVNEGDGVCGVLARSAGVWENDKVVCSCSGKTVWQEREEQTSRGIL